MQVKVLAAQNWCELIPIPRIHLRWKEKSDSTELLYGLYDHIHTSFMHTYDGKIFLKTLRPKELEIIN